MNNRENFWTGLVLGGLLGMTLALMLNKTTSGNKEPLGQAKKQGNLDIQDNNKKQPGLSNQNPLTDKEDGKKDDKKEVKQTPEQLKQEDGSANKEQPDKKTAGEGENNEKEFTGKINFGQRIAQLEEALKGLRDEEG